MDDCIFCQIVADELPSYKIYEDRKFCAFLAIHPIREGHTLVIPKKHYRWVWDIPEPGDYFQTVSKIANHFRRLNRNTNNIIYSLVMGTNSTHANIHIIPAPPSFERNIRAKLTSKPTSKITSEAASRAMQRYKMW